MSSKVRASYFFGRYFVRTNTNAAMKSGKVMPNRQRELQPREARDDGELQRVPRSIRSPQPRLRHQQTHAFPELVARQRLEGHEDEEAVQGRVRDRPQDRDERPDQHDARQHGLAEVRVALLPRLLDDLDDAPVREALRPQDAQALRVQRRLRNQPVAGRDAQLITHHTHHYKD